MITFIKNFYIVRRWLKRNFNGYKLKRTKLDYNSISVSKVVINDIEFLIELNKTIPKTINYQLL